MAGVSRASVFVRMVLWSIRNCAPLVRVDVRQCVLPRMLHALPRLSAALVHTDPQARQGTDPHAVLAPHR